MSLKVLWNTSCILIHHLHIFPRAIAFVADRVRLKGEGMRQTGNGHKENYQQGIIVGSII
jgi:hypothetical protein